MCIFIYTGIHQIACMIWACLYLIEQPDDRQRMWWLFICNMPEDREWWPARLNFYDMIASGPYILHIWVWIFCVYLLICQCVPAAPFDWFLSMARTNQQIENNKPTNKNMTENMYSFRIHITFDRGLFHLIDTWAHMQAISILDCILRSENVIEKKIAI